MDDAVQSWKKTLEAGGKVPMPVTATNLTPFLSRGDEAVVAKVRFNTVKQGDVVLAQVEGSVGLYKVAQAWMLAGVECLEVAGRGPDRHGVPEANLLGKVVEVKKGAARLELLLPTAARFFRRLAGT